VGVDVDAKYLVQVCFFAFRIVEESKISRDFKEFVMKSLKRLSIIAATALVSATTVHAALTITETVGNATSYGNGNFTPITFKLTALTGSDTTLGSGSAPAGLLLLDGTFTATNGGIVATPGDKSADSNGTSFGADDGGSWRDFIAGSTAYGVHTLNTDSGSFTYAASGVNLSSVALGQASAPYTYLTGATNQGATFDDTQAVATITGNATGLTADWYSSTALQPGNTTILAKIYVTAGDNVGFSGVYSTYGSNSAPLTFGVTAVPEPASLSLLGLGATSLLARRRRRKA